MTPAGSHVVFIHGLWLHASSWAPWTELFQEAGYAPVAPGWPGAADTVQETRDHPGQVAGKGIDDVVEHYAQIIRGLDAPPVVIGHSFGGLIVQRLLGQDLAAAGVAIDAAPVKGVLYLPPSALRVASIALRSPANRTKAVALTPEQFRYGFGNALPAQESAELYERWTVGGIYFPALELTETVSLRLFADELIRFSGSPVPPFRDWLDAIPYLFRLAGDRVVPVVIDEFPFLVKASPGLPSIIQRELGPGGSGSASRVRLLLCGSAMSVMGGLLSGPAPLRGRAGLELVVHPFGYRDAARFWEINDPRLAVLVHSVVGGTPAYRRELLREDTPADLADFDAWMIRTVLNPQTPLFREARYLLAEETEIRDPSLYHSVLTAVAEGNTTSGGIASYIGRKSNEVAHPLRVLEDSRLLIKEPDLFRSGRARYSIAEPLITFYQAIMSREWARLELGGGPAVWPGNRARFLSQVTGPHFEAICRDYAIAADPAVFGGPPGEVGSGVVQDPANRTQIEIDVAVLAPAEHGRPRRVLSLGEVKWDRVMNPGHVERLRRARDLLAVKGFDTRDTVLTCYSGAGFDRELQAGQRHDIRLVGLDQLYVD